MNTRSLSIAGTHTLRNQRRDFSEWHRGRAPYVFWALDLDFPEVGQRVAEATRHLDGLLLDGYRRQPHVTLELCGFPAAVPAADDEFPPSRLESQCRVLQRARVPAFGIEVGSLASFASAPYLAVRDDGGQIAALRACLASHGRYRLDGPFVPHVTVGLYADVWPLAEVRSRLAAFEPAAPVPCRVGRVSLMSYVPGEIGGPLTCIGDFDLVRHEMRWRERLLFPGNTLP